MEQYRFLARDLEALQQRLTRYEAEWRAVLAGTHESTTQSSETWHDNPQFDDVQQRAKMLDTERRRLAAILANSVLVQPAAPNGRVDVGSVVKVRYGSGATDEFTVGSYMVLGADEDRISYDAPLARLLLGHTAGEKVAGTVNGRKTELEIVSVRVAEEQPSSGGVSLPTGR